MRSGRLKEHFGADSEASKGTVCLRTGTIYRMGQVSRCCARFVLLTPVYNYRKSPVEKFH
jgi:hypothetical protein